MIVRQAFGGIALALFGINVVMGVVRPKPVCMQLSAPNILLSDGFSCRLSCRLLSRIVSQPWHLQLDTACIVPAVVARCEMRNVVSHRHSAPWADSAAHLQALRSDRRCSVSMRLHCALVHCQKLVAAAPCPPPAVDDFGVAPAQTHKFRRVFNPVHHWVGRFALVFAIINVYLGLHLSDVPPPPPPPRIAAATLYKGVQGCTRKPPFPNVVDLLLFLLSRRIMHSCHLAQICRPYVNL